MASDRAMLILKSKRGLSDDRHAFDDLVGEEGRIHRRRMTGASYRFTASSIAPSVGPTERWFQLVKPAIELPRERRQHHLLGVFLSQGAPRAGWQNVVEEER
jgi:hypothetical protein